MTRSYLRYIALGALLIVVAVAAMIYLLVAGPDGGAGTVPTEVQIFGTTTTVRSAAPATSTTTASAAASTASTTTTTTSTTARPAKDASGLTVVRATQLPKEAQQTLVLIAKGGPFPYDRDGVVFENRERILPKKTSGYYHEYTVVTPGERDRGARRIITGSSGERFYTADHYETFVRVEEGP